jgi:hypothetical protein
MPSVRPSFHRPRNSSDGVATIATAGASDAIRASSVAIVRVAVTGNRAGTDSSAVTDSHAATGDRAVIDPKEMIVDRVTIASLAAIARGVSKDASLETTAVRMGDDVTILVPMAGGNKNGHRRHLK